MALRRTLPARQADDDLAAALAGTVVVAALVGGLTGASALSEPVPGGGELNVAAGIALVLLVIAGLVWVPPVRRCALAGAAGLSVLSLAEYLGSPALHIGAIGRMPLATSVCVLLLVLAATTCRWPHVRQFAALGGGAIAALVLVGFGFGTRTLAIL